MTEDPHNQFLTSIFKHIYFTLEMYGISPIGKRKIPQF